MCWVYIVECSDKTYYCGATKDLIKRIDLHNTGKGAKYTRNRLPVKLMWSKNCNSYSEALKEEWRIKRLSRREKESLIKK
jgi:putative endonuclease